VNYSSVFNPNNSITDIPSTGQLQFDTGWLGLVSAGYAMNGFRVEGEGGFRHNVETNNSDLKLDEWTAMANLLYDIPVSNMFKITLGGGAGGDSVHIKDSGDNFDDKAWTFAYQGIAGLTIGLSKRLDFAIEYRYLRVTAPDQLSSIVTAPSAGSRSYDLDDLSKHAVTAGFRYSLGADAPPPPPPVEAPPPPPPVAPEPPKAPKEFIVFFGHNMSDLTPEAVEVVKQAAEAAKTYGSASIAVVGHADRSGSDAYNIALSTKRANSVKTGLVTAGISEAAIGISAKGESEPLVPTDDGVREPQNRRVNITLP
jgi:outer membrane protein OmpA-like peptidoglycan-associated protein